MSILGGWLGPAFQVLNAQRAGAAQGKAQGDQLAYERQKDQEEKQRQLKADALQSQLLKLKIAEAKQPAEWHPTTKQDYLDIHPEKPETTPNIDPLSSEGISATLRRKRGETAIDNAHPKPPSQTQQDDMAKGSAILDQYVNRGAYGKAPDSKRPDGTVVEGKVVDPQGVARVGAFGAAFQAIRSKNPTMAPEIAAVRAVESMKSTQPDLYRQGSEDNDYVTPTPPTPGATKASAPVTPAAGSAIGGTIPAKAPDTQKAMAQRWDELTSQGMDGEAAKQKVLEEFQGK